MKKMILILTVAGIVMAASTAFAAYDSTLVAYWKFDEAGGAGTAYDSTTNDHDATINGTAGATGEYGNAVYLDGTDDNVYVPDHSHWNLGSGNFTVSFRVKYNSFNGSGNVEYMIGKFRDQDGGRGWMIRSSWSGDRMDLRYSTNGTNEQSAAYATGLSMSTNTWYNFTITRTSSTDTRLYMDGSQVGDTYTTDYTMYNPSGASLYMGDRTLGSTQELNGWLDEVAIWHEGFNADQVRELSELGVEAFEQAGQPIPEPGTVLFALAGLGFAIKRRRV